MKFKIRQNSQFYAEYTYLACVHTGGTAVLVIGYDDSGKLYEFPIEEAIIQNEDTTKREQR